MSSFYRTETEIEAVVLAFESCETDKTKFKHRDHLTVAVWYVHNFGAAEANSKMRTALRRLLNHHGVDSRKYNETITMFWIEMVDATLGKVASGASLVERCNQVIDSLDNGELALEYYTKKLLLSDQARESFVNPDLKSWRNVQREVTW